MLAGAITLMDEFYYKLAVWLNDKGIKLLNYFQCKPINNKQFSFRKLSRTI